MLVDLRRLTSRQRDTCIRCVARGAGVSGTVIVGTQWGDEGKGRFTDYRAQESALVLRCQGGHNGGHRIVGGDEVFAFQLVPGGVLSPPAPATIGNGVVVDPAVLIAELDMLAGKG